MRGRALWITCAVLAVLIAGLLWQLQREPATDLVVRAGSGDSDAAALESPSRPDGSTDQRPLPLDPERSRVADRTAEGPIVVADVAETARQLNIQGNTAQQDLEVLQVLLDFHRRANGGRLPTGGENAEIVEQLSGRNEKRLAVLPPGLKAVDTEGRLLDRWNTPYFFHAVSAEHLEVRSAGPDRKLWTEDDVSTEPAQPEPESATVATSETQE